MNFKERAKELVSQMTIEEKIKSYGGQKNGSTWNG